MMILCVRDILNWVESHPQHTYTIRVSYLEVYNEEINDLLGDGRNMRIVSEDAARGAVIGGLVEEVVKSSADFMEVLLRGEASRSYASTGMNETSSRSHTIYKVSFEAQDRDSSGSTSRISYLNLVDLAGSERQKSTKAEGKILKEGANINRSLLALGAVINKLGEATKKVKGAKPVFIPYRDSKLTRILKQSLGGNTLTSMLCAVTPAPMHREETVSTLKFGQLCKNIKNMVKGNDGLLDDKALLKQYRTQLNELRSQLEEFAGPASAGLEPEVLIANAMREKNELENKLRTLETAVRSSGADGLDLASLMTFDSSLNGDGAAQYSKLEITKLNEKIAEQQQLISQYRSSLDEFQDLEESKAAFEEYEHHHKQELEEEIAKLENEKVVLQRERAKILKDRSSVDEKESRIGQLITNLDEKESKLRQMMGTMKEQQEQWQRSVSDLQRREDLVDDWQRTHRQREKRLQEIDKAQEDKFKELNSREKTLSEGEQRLKTQERELQEREQRLQVALSRVANSEQALSAQEEKLTAFEAALKKKEGDADIRERELLSRRKEMESWDVLLREKDRKVSIEQRSLDEREAAVHAQEEKARLRDSDAERRLTELRQNEATVASQMDTYTKQLAELDSQALTLKADQKKCAQLQEDLSNKEAELTSWENRLKKLQELMSGINEREADLNKRIEQHKQVEDEFFNVKVAQITSRHTKELGQLEAMVSQQLKIVSNFQKELDSTRADLAQKTNEIAEYEVSTKYCDCKIRFCCITFLFFRVGFSGTEKQINRST